MRWSVNVGRLAGVRIELHVTFLLLLGWIAVQGGLLAGRPRAALTAVALVLAVFACVVLHELGHALAARHCGIATRGIVLLPIGGVALLERMPERPRQELRVAIAGPAVNAALAVLLAALLAITGRPTALAALDDGVLELLLLVNVLMVLFNLIPAFPMDGGRVLRALLAMQLSPVRATRVASFVGQGAALVLGAAAIAVVHNVTLALIAVFVFVAAGAERARASAPPATAPVPRDVSAA